MISIKQHLAKHTANWHFARVLRLVLGVSFMIGAIQEVDYLLGGISLLLIVQAIMNTGCGGGACAIDNSKK